MTLKRYENETRGAGDFNDLSASHNKSCDLRNELHCNSSGRTCYCGRGGKFVRSGKKNRKDNKINSVDERLKRKQRESLCLKGFFFFS